MTAPVLSALISVHDEEHQLAECLERLTFADEIVVMLEGRVVEFGPKAEVLRPPHHEYTELLLSSVPEMDPDWLEGLLESRDATP